MKNVVIKRLFHRDQNCLGIFYDFDTSINQEVKKIPLVKFSATNTDSQPIVGNGTIELFDVTNNMVIQNSKITSDNADRLVSNNIYSTLPSDRIDIGFRISSENDQFISRTGNIYLILIKNQ